MARRRFDHLVMELSLALDRPIPRYPLWLYLHEVGYDPELLTRREAVEFCERYLDFFLARHGAALAPRRARRLLRQVERFDPTFPTPEERFARS